MRSLKFHSLSAVVVGVRTSLVWAPAASATVLWQTTPNGADECTGGTYAVGHEIKAELEGTAS
jgi:hypothetical protein